jgi:hypothetical protein
MAKGWGIYKSVAKSCGEKARAGGSPGGESKQPRSVKGGAFRGGRGTMDRDVCLCVCAAGGTFEARPLAFGFASPGPPTDCRR